MRGKVIKTTEEFTNDLINKNIKIEINEEYRGNLAYHKFRCFCGNIFEATPKSILQKRKPDCGCVQINKVKERYNEECIEKYEFINLEDYIDIKTKILHECKKCKDKILIEPKRNKINRCKKCVSIEKREKYLSDIKKLKIELLDDFNEDRTIKLKHKCFCGNIWITSRESVLKGSGCGCRKLLMQEELYLNRKTILYYIKIDNIYKIGIVLFEKYKSIEKAILNGRYKQFVGDLKRIKILKVIIFENGLDALNNERKIISENISKKYNGERFINENGKAGGETECFNDDIYENIRRYFETK